MECFTADFLEFSSTNVKIGLWLLLVGWLGIHKRVEALGPFNPVRGVEGSARARALPSGVYLAAGLQWHFACGFDFSGFAVLRGLLMVPVGTMGSF